MMKITKMILMRMRMRIKMAMIHSTTYPYIYSRSTMIDSSSITTSGTECKYYTAFQLLVVVHFVVNTHYITATTIQSITMFVPYGVPAATAAAVVVISSPR